ncbi:hypothetical protein C2E23DRAFT_886413 [Lenzites betulinus]|nr:hypothetical protein C2E23DRAFT_886413 [Lenzites betulinus]
MPQSTSIPTSHPHFALVEYARDMHQYTLDLWLDLSKKLDAHDSRHPVPPALPSRPNHGTLRTDSDDVLDAESPQEFLRCSPHPLLDLCCTWPMHASFSICHPSRPFFLTIFIVDLWDAVLVPQISTLFLGIVPRAFYEATRKGYRENRAILGFPETARKSTFSR